MPELPEVETYVRELKPRLADRHIAAVDVRWQRTIAAPAPEEFVSRAIGQKFRHFGRRGKYMLFGLTGDDTLIVHLRMTGKLLLRPASSPVDRHTHVVLTLDNGEQLHYNDTRKFGRIWLTADPASVLVKLGPEPLGDLFSVDGFITELAGRKATIKALLLDQSIVAGVGNIYADEALFAAGINPKRPGGTLSEPEARALRNAIRDVLIQGINARGSSLGANSSQNYLRPGGEQGEFQQFHQVFRRTGEPCFVCGMSIERIVLAQRSTHYCPTCQPA